MQYILLINIYNSITYVIQYYWDKKFLFTGIIILIVIPVPVLHIFVNCMCVLE